MFFIQVSVQKSLIWIISNSQIDSNSTLWLILWLNDMVMSLLQHELSPLFECVLLLQRFSEKIYQYIIQHWRWSLWTRSGKGSVRSRDVQDGFGQNHKSTVSYRAAIPEPSKMAAVTQISDLQSCRDFKQQGCVGWCPTVLFFLLIFWSVCVRSGHVWHE